jgi:hypothetical protein
MSEIATIWSLFSRELCHPGLVSPCPAWASFLFSTTENCATSEGNNYLQAFPTFYLNANRGVQSPSKISRWRVSHPPRRQPHPAGNSLNPNNRLRWLTSSTSINRRPVMDDLPVITLASSGISPQAPQSPENSEQASEGSVRSQQGENPTKLHIP